MTPAAVIAATFAVVGVVGVVGGLTVARAQAIYRSVGPDGKVIFSDQPPGASGGAYDAGRSAPPAAGSVVTVPPAAPGALGDPEVLRHPGVAKRAAKQAIKPAKSPEQSPEQAPKSSLETAATAAPRDPALEGAVIGVLGIEDLVQHSTDLCLEVLPTSFRKITTTADGWRQRNAELVRQARLALSKEFDPDQRRELENAIRQRNDAVFTPVVNAERAQKITWCDRTNDSLVAGEMDLSGKPKLAGPLAGYRPR